MINAAVWGVSWWPVRELHALGLHPLWATACFFVVSTLAVTGWRPDAWATLRRQPELWVLAFASGLTNAAFNWALTLGEVVRVVLLFYLMPVWAVFLARWLLNERISAQGLLRTALALTGAALVLRPPDGGWPTLTSAADWLGVLGGVGFALTNVMLRRLAPATPQSRALAMFVGGWALPVPLAAGLAAAGLLPWLPPPAVAWMVGAVFMALIFLAANLALQYGAARLPVHAAAVIMLTEIVFAAASAVWLGGEELHPALYTGGALILLAALLATREG